MRQESPSFMTGSSQHLLDEVPGLAPPTLENLCLFIARALADMQPAPWRERVWREALGDSCTLEW